jgi:hypothetical protein
VEYTWWLYRRRDGIRAGYKRSCISQVHDDLIVFADQGHQTTAGEWAMLAAVGATALVFLASLLGTF